MNKKTFIISMLVMLLPFIEGGTAYGCTSIIVSGRVTPDGRPFIFKNRDTPDLNNCAVLVQGKRYKYIGIVAAADTLLASMWSGHNEAGFAIANTAAYNLNPKPANGAAQGDERDGMLMREALETCATLHDFELMLDSIKAQGDIPSNSNFAVMDAQGGVAYYETGNKGYVKFDANDPTTAPYGYIIRTNHGMTGDRSMDKGVERFMAMSEFATQAELTGTLDFELIIRHATRYLKHGLTHQNLYDIMPKDEQTVTYVPFRDFIPRYSTASAQLIQGVLPGESPLHTVAWTIPGSTLTTVAIPLMITKNGKLPQTVTHDSKKGAPLVQAGLLLKKRLFSLKRGSTADYLDLSKLINKEGTGILQKLAPIEDEIFSRACPLLEKIRNGNVSAKGKKQKDNTPAAAMAGKEMEDYYTWIDQYLTEQYQPLFHIDLKTVCN